ncbi:MAG: nuclear transport factor 2 family protein [Zavarzinia sp.]|nr:nuclear transport factor 2 family protein [Zavarzinia sp.]
MTDIIQYTENSDVARATDAEVANLRARLDRLESRDAVRRLMAAYMQGCDDRLGAGIADLFWPDGIWEGLGGAAGGRLVGREAIAKSFAAAPARLTFTTHYLTNESIMVDGDRATGCWKLFEPCTFQERMALWMGGRYRNDFERRDGEWRLSHLRLWVEFRTPFEEGWLKQPMVPLVSRDGDR